MALSIATARQFARLVSRGDFRAASQIFDAMITGDFLPETITATAAELNAAADLSVRTVVVPAGGAAVTLPSGGGTILIPLVTANVTATLPAPTAGLTYEFIYIGSAADAEDWVISCPAAVLFAGGIEHLVTGTADIDPEIANGSTENTLTVNNPTVGTAVRFIGTGTAWGVTGFTCGVNIAVFSAV